jgi:hypothetical protein
MIRGVTPPAIDKDISHLIRDEEKIHDIIQVKEKKEFKK